jgi:pimeloyl-ACP methyl ester carboxylesterase
VRARSWVWAALVLVVVLGLVAGTVALVTRPPKPSGTPSQLPPLAETSPQPDDPAVSSSYRRFYDQRPAWTPCRSDAECTSVAVPVDWNEPEGASIELAVVRLPATDPAKRLGALVMNPGGPGASGVEYVGNFGRFVTTEGLRARYDLVGFDPRGVGGSHPVDCLPDAAMDDYLAFDADPDTPGGLEAMRQEADLFAAGCAASAGQLLGHLDTVSAAKDMDVLRAVLGEQRLKYLGKSYGTLLGATYAGEYPHRVGRMVLDGALDPASTYDDLLMGQAGGMEQALRSYLTDCIHDDRRCPFTGDVDTAARRVRQLLARVDDDSLPTTDPQRPLTAPLAVTGIIQPLYEDLTWPNLTAALTAAFSGDGSPLLALADQYADRESNGHYDGNLLEAFVAINCLDYPMDDDPAAMRSQERRLLGESPTFGSSLAYGEVTCGEWPVPPVRTPAPIRAKGAPPILVVGTTGDPATPYHWAQSLADELASGRLLTWEGEGHTAYVRGSGCVDGAVDRYVVEGELPGQGATCRR